MTLSNATKHCEHCDAIFPYERVTAKFCSGACRKANHDAQQSKTPRELEGDALLTVRARQQKKEIERALIAARKAVRATKKIERDRLKAENKQLGIEQALEIQTGDNEIATKFAEQAQSDFTNGILGIQIAAQDKQEGL
jgi:hypothetical protein